MTNERILKDHKELSAKEWTVLTDGLLFLYNKANIDAVKVFGANWFAGVHDIYIDGEDCYSWAMYGGESLGRVWASGRMEIWWRGVGLWPIRGRLKNEEGKANGNNG